MPSTGDRIRRRERSQERRSAITEGSPVLPSARGTQHRTIRGIFEGGPTGKRGSDMSEVYAPLRQPLVVGDKSLGQVTADICGPLERRAGPLWWVAFLVS